MSYQGYGNTQYEYNDTYNEENIAAYDSEEDTEEASETEFRPNRSYGEPIEIKEQMYQDKLANLKKQLDELNNACHPEYTKRVKKLELQYKERLRLNEIHRDYLKECVERDYFIEKKAAAKEYDEKKTDLRENLLTDFEDKRRLIESERHSLELTSDSMEIKPTITRKLRRRPNEPIPVVEKRRKPTTGQLLVYLLDEKEIECDLKQITRGKMLTPNPVASNGIGSHNHQGGMIMEVTPTLVETRIEDGKLLYERRWFHRGQTVYIEGKDLSRFAATISAIGNEVVWVKKLTDNNKVKINMSQLSKGKITIKRRAN